MPVALQENGLSRQTSMWRALNTRTRLNLPPEQPVDTLVSTDYEGPQVKTDIVSGLMGDHVHPDGRSIIPGSKLKYGEEIYTIGYNRFTALTEPKRKLEGRTFHRKGRGERPSLSQEGSDTSFPIPFFLAAGVTDADLKKAADDGQEIPGAKAFNTYIRKNNGYILGITTAPSAPYQDTSKELGLHRLEGSSFSIDAVKQKLIDSGKWREEMLIVFRYINDMYSLLEKREASQDPEEKIQVSAALEARAGHFYEDELGVSFDQDVRESRTAHKTIIGKAIEDAIIVGDRSKTAISLMYRRNNAKKGTFHIKVGDGGNDKENLRTLEENDFSISVNGGPSKFATVGVITPDMNTLTILVDMRRKHPELDNVTLLRRARLMVRKNKELSKKTKRQTVFHIGGPDVHESFIQQGKTMKNKIRGRVG